MVRLLISDEPLAARQKGQHEFGHLLRHVESIMHGARVLQCHQLVVAQGVQLRPYVQGWIDQVNKGDQGPGSKAHVSAGPKQETQWPCIHEDEVEWARERLSAKSTPTRDDGKPASTR